MLEPVVLLVTDDPKRRSSIKTVLRERNYRVVVTRGSLEALAAAARLPIEAVIVKEELPGVRGSELARILSRTFPGLPVMYLEEVAGDAEMAGQLDALITARRKPASSSKPENGEQSKTA